jgi:hypothetical protein
MLKITCSSPVNQAAPINAEILTEWNSSICMHSLCGYDYEHAHDIRACQRAYGVRKKPMMAGAE